MKSLLFFIQCSVGGERNEDGQRLEIKKGGLEMKDRVGRKHRRSKRGNSRGRSTEDSRDLERGSAGVSGEQS